MLREYKMHIWILVALVVAIALMTLITPTEGYENIMGFDEYVGRDIRASGHITMKVKPGIKGCQEACKKSAQCIGFSVSKSGKKDSNGRNCRLKREPATAKTTKWSEITDLFQRDADSTLFVKRGWRNAMLVNAAVRTQTGVANANVANNAIRAAAAAKAARATAAAAAKATRAAFFAPSVDPSRTTFPEVVGMRPELARSVILSSRPALDVVVLAYGGVVPEGFNPNRVRVFYDNSTGLVFQAPFIA